MTSTRRNVVAGFAAAGLSTLIPPGLVLPAMAQTGKPKKGGIAKMWLAEPVMLTGAFNSAGQIYQVSGKIFDGLVSYGFDFKPRPQLATSWETSADGKTFTFKLRPGVKWHDGQPFTSADLQYSALKVWKELHPRGRSTYRYLTEVETPDPLTAILRFERPAPYVMNSLAGIESQILPRHLYEGKDILTNPANLKPVGTGPFKFKEWQRGQYIVLERNADYWDAPKPYLDGVIMVIMPDAAARAVALESGELDIAGAIPVALVDARRLEKVPTLTIPPKGSEALGSQSFMEINLRKPYFQDVRVRQALYHAIDRAFVAKNIYFDFGKPSTGPLSQDSKFYSGDVPKYDYSLDKANALLDEAGLKRGADGLRLKITHDYLPFGDHYARSADYFKQQMARIGIAVDIRASDFPTYYKRVYGAESDFDTTSTGAFGLTDPTVGVQRFYWSKNIVPGVAFSNGSGYNSPACDAALDAAQTEMDEVKRTAVFRDFQNIVMKDLPILPICDTQYITIKSKTLMNTEVDPFGVHGSFADAWLDR